MAAFDIQACIGLRYFKCYPLTAHFCSLRFCLGQPNPGFASFYSVSKTLFCLHRWGCICHMAGSDTTGPAVAEAGEAAEEERE